MRYKLRHIRSTLLKKRPARLILALCVTATVIVGITIYSSLVSEGAVESIKYAATTRIGEFINLSVNDFFENNEGFADEIILKTEDISSGSVTYTPNSELLERAEREIYEGLSRYLRKNDVIKVKIPIGTLTKSTYLSGKGFKIAVSAYTIPAISSEIIWQVEDGGINQTIYTAALTLRVDCQIMFGSTVESVSVESKKNIFTKIIVGSVPLGSN